MRNRTWLGIVVCILAVIPGLVGGGVLAFVAKAMMGGQMDDSFWIFRAIGFNGPTLVMKWLFGSAIPSALHGGIAGAVAVGITHLIYTGPKISTAAWTAGIAYSALVLFSVIVGSVVKSFDLTAAEAIIQLVGFWIGLGIVVLMVNDRKAAIA